MRDIYTGRLTKSNYYIFSYPLYVEDQELEVKIPLRIVHNAESIIVLNKIRDKVSIMNIILNMKQLEL